MGFTGSGFTNLCDFTGIILASVVNFILPPWLYLLAIRMNVIDFKHPKYKDAMMPLSGVDNDSEDYSQVAQISDNEKDSKITMKNSTPDNVIVDDDDDMTEQIQLIDMHNGSNSSIDVDIAK